MPMRTLPYEVVKSCTKQLSKRFRKNVVIGRTTGIGKNRAVQDVAGKLYVCALDQFTEKYGPPSGPVQDRIDTIAHRTAAGIVRRELKRKR